MGLRSAPLHVVGHTLLLRAEELRALRASFRVAQAEGLPEAKPGKLEGPLKLTGNVQLRPLRRQAGADEDLR